MDIKRQNYDYYSNTSQLTITISPPPRPGDIDMLYVYDTKLIIQQINKLSQHYIIYPEFDGYGRLHYHGVIDVNNKTKIPRMIYNLKTKLGYVKMDTLKTFFCHLGWLIYCQKEYARTRNYFRYIINPIMYRKVHNTIKDIRNPHIKININDYFKK